MNFSKFLMSFAAPTWVEIELNGQAQVMVYIQSSPCCFNWKKLVWLGLAPPKVKGIIWLTLHGRAPVTVELVKRGAWTASDTICPMCRKGQETFQHIFFSCEVAWTIWSKFYACWGLSLVHPREPTLFFVSWREVPCNQYGDSNWLVIPFAAIWFIWLMRNDVIFNNKVVNLTFLRC
ncbi:hypothetical protein V6N11_070655 [Hibiscus sabdariffa]|uniref:Reverse transcriptase zinc-binding domain-containing protein n=1 Tax=Hibiscus sabdariffa TaxID=183260 RepID=A0ABR2QFP3_9ROSI